MRRPPRDLDLRGIEKGDKHREEDVDYSAREVVITATVTGAWAAIHCTWDPDLGLAATEMAGTLRFSIYILLPEGSDFTHLFGPS